MFSNRLKEMRTCNNMTQAELADALGVSKGTVAMWETGKRKPNFETLNTLSSIFDKKIDYILGYSNDSSSVRIVECDAGKSIWKTDKKTYKMIMSYLRLDEFGKNAVESVILAEISRCKKYDSLCSEDDFMLSLRMKNNLQKEYGGRTK